ncbi:GNAT family N-acetyltransferase [Wenxinia saemankumensis]|uniref:Putative acetyltransferase n=1 Tax=Wenxinia saemankumensis TaxID=1447782 RepID=A0A1M6EHR5_9RHOB|nr:N-acetyltransferase [Wenxinia saemankumensis]SHI85015.1 putative acetyltransferase [Wenxinia saemankumensis]
MSVAITDERPADAAAIRALVESAFAGAPYASGNEGRIVDGLRADGDMTFSLVAVQDGVVVGHLAASPARVGTAPGWLAIGPLAVAPALQRQGIGSRLLEAALQRATRAGAPGLVLVGDPGYYGRFGFAAAPGLTYRATDAHHILRRTLAGPAATGEIRFAPALQGA